MGLEDFRSVFDTDGIDLTIIKKKTKIGKSLAKIIKNV